MIRYCPPFLLLGLTAAGFGRGPVFMHQQPIRFSMSADSVQVPMALFDGRILVDVTLDGKGPFPFIFDTGAQGSVMDLAFARDQGLELGPEIQVASPGGRGRPGNQVSIEKLGIGGLTLEGVTSIAFDGLPFARTPTSPRGVLSPYALNGLLIALDYPGQRLVFRSGALPEADGREVFGWDRGRRLPEIPASVGQESVLLHLDTGASSGVSLPTALAERLPLDGPLVDMGFAKTIDQAKQVLGAPLKGSIGIGRYTLERPTLRFVDMASGVGNVGAAVLRQFVITIDPANARLRLAGPSDGVLGESGELKPRYGLQLDALDASPLQVRVVDAGSLADKAGLRSGDRITQMNGRAVESLGASERVDALRGSPLAVTILRDKHTFEISMAFP